MNSPGKEKRNGPEVPASRAFFVLLQIGSGSRPPILGPTGDQPVSNVDCTRFAGGCNLGSTEFKSRKLKSKQIKKHAYI
jgi:hypothetical protein